MSCNRHVYTGFSCVCTGNMSALRARRWLVGEVECETWAGTRWGIQEMCVRVQVCGGVCMSIGARQHECVLGRGAESVLARLTMKGCEHFSDL